MDGSEAHASWHFVLLIFVFFAILRSMEWTAPDYQNSLVFMNETGKHFLCASPNEEHDMKNSASDVHVQHKILMIPQPTN